MSGTWTDSAIEASQANARTQDPDGPIVFALSSHSNAQLPGWKLLIVDDEPEIHNVTRLVLKDFFYARKGLEFLSAHSGGEAREVLEADPDIAVVLLDVVMETEDAGLQIARFIRQSLGNQFMRIILRTGQPGVAPEREIIQRYDINDYRSKTELTQERMFSVLHTALSSYHHLSRLASNSRHVSHLVEEYRALLERISIRLNEPTHGLVRGLDHLDPHLSTQMPEGLRPHWQQMREGTNRLVALNRTLSLLRRLEQPMNESRGQFSGQKAVSDVLSRCRERIEQLQARVAVNGEWPALLGYRELFIRMLEELLHNALSHHGDTPPDVEIGMQPQGRFWCISVGDRGRGIGAAQADENPDSDAPPAAQQPAGLGLLLCRKVASLHGGTMYIESRPDGGTLVRVQLPSRNVQA